jgi:hypothetical protein
LLRLLKRDVLRRRYDDETQNTTSKVSWVRKSQYFHFHRWWFSFVCFWFRIYNKKKLQFMLVSSLSLLWISMKLEVKQKSVTWEASYYRSNGGDVVGPQQSIVINYLMIGLMLYRITCLVFHYFQPFLLCSFTPSLVYSSIQMIQKHHINLICRCY